jgi:hypothetical protein
VAHEPTLIRESAAQGTGRGPTEARVREPSQDADRFRPHPFIVRPSQLVKPSTPIPAAILQLPQLIEGR